MNRQHWILFSLLAVVFVVEGFDVNLANVVLPYVGKEFAAGPAQLGRALSTMALGAVIAFFVIRMADLHGRRLVLLGSVAGFSLLSIATAFAPDLRIFVLLQFVARIMLVTQVTVAYVLLSETLPAANRGRMMGLLAAFASMGAALPALLLQTAVESWLGWRGLFMLGGLPLLLVPLLALRVRESDVFRVGRSERSQSVRVQLRELLTKDLRGRFLAISAVWFIVNFWAATAMFFFTYYVLQSRHWTAHDLQVLAPLTLVGSFAGYVGAGVLMDRYGRRTATGALLLVGMCVTILCYRSESFAVIAAAWIMLQMLQGVWPVVYTYTSELFPTRIRAAANGLAHNFLGRWGMVAAPMLVGFAAESFGGMGQAVATLALLNLLVVPLLWWVLPETRDIDLSRAGGGVAER